MYTANDIANVLAYNKTREIFYITESKRVMWRVNNGDKARLQTMLSKRFEYAEDFAQLKKQVRAELKAQGVA
jgi:hypothetical protein